MAKCPMCSGEMQITTVVGIDLDVCSRCRGIWFKPDEIKQVLNLEPSILAQIPFYNDPPPREDAAWDPPPAFCPACSAALNPKRFEEAIPVIAQVCSHEHGFWLDHDKLRSIKHFNDGLVKSILVDDIEPEASKILESEQIVSTPEAQPEPEKIRRDVALDSKQAFSIPRNDAALERIRKIVEKGNKGIARLNPKFGRISFGQKRQVIMAGSLFCAVAILGLFLSLAPSTPESKVISRAFETKEAQANVELNNKYYEDLSKITSTKAARPQAQQDQTAGTAITADQAQAAQKEQQDKVLAAKIDAYLAHRGSPMAGTGATFVAAANETGVNPVLSVAIAGKESSFGLYCFVTHNAWGMKAPQYSNGFASWEEGIWANSRYLLSHFGKVSSPYQCPGYCVPDHPWMEDVTSIMAAIQAG
jgi:Zn-finger nucleic acid-binding protein